MADLIINDVALGYGASEILKGVSVAVPAGKVVALLGPSGSGKTTLLRAVAGLESPYRGSIRIGDNVLFDAGKNVEQPAEARGLGLVFQSYALWPHRTVFDNVAYGLKLRKVRPTQIKNRVEDTLGQIGLAHLAARYPHQLSGGQQQHVALGAGAGLRAARYPARRAVIQSRREAARGGPGLAAGTHCFSRSLRPAGDARSDRGDGGRRPHHAAQWRTRRAARVPD